MQSNTAVLQCVCMCIPMEISRSYNTDISTAAELGSESVQSYHGGGVSMVAEMQCSGHLAQKEWRELAWRYLVATDRIVYA